MVASSQLNKARLQQVVLLKYMSPWEDPKANDKISKFRIVMCWMLCFASSG